MVSLLTMIVNAVSGALIYGLKAFFSMISWFGKSFAKLLKLLYVVLPVTCIIFVLLFLVNIFMLCTGEGNMIPEGVNPDAAIDSQVAPPIPEINIPGNLVDDKQVQKEAGLILIRDSRVVSRMFGELKSWWIGNVYSLQGSAAYIFLLILTVLMFLPVICVLLCISVFSGFSSVLFIAVVVDAALYLVRAITGSSFLKQAQGRYFKLFPEAGRRHYEKSYDKFLKSRDKQMQKDIRQGKRNKAANFYDDFEDLDVEDEPEYSHNRQGRENYDDYKDYDDYDDRRYGRHRRYDDDPVDEFFEDDVDDEDFYEDEEFDEEYGDYAGDYDEDYDKDVEDYDDDYEEDYEDDYDDPKRRRHYRGYEEYDEQDEASRQSNTASSGSFDFFAGCTSRESVDKKYKSLVKLYHPDNMDGDTAALQEINAQYSTAKKRFS